MEQLGRNLLLGFAIGILFANFGGSAVAERKESIINKFRSYSFICW
jgi:hypothetical protein